MAPKKTIKNEDLAVAENPRSENLVEQTMGLEARASNTPFHAVGSTTMETGDISYKYLPREVPGITDKNHVLFGGKLPSAIDRFPVCKNEAGRFVLNLSPQEESFIMDGLGLMKGDLNTFDKSNEYLDNLMIEVPRHGVTLNTSNPYDYLVDKILLGYTGIFAPSIAAKNNKKSYRYVRIKQSEETLLRLESSDEKKIAYKLLGGLEESREKMIMYLLNSKVRVHPGIKNLDLKALVNEIAERNFKKFILTLNDELFIEKGLVNMGVILDVIQVKSGLHFFEGQPLAFTGQAATDINAAKYLMDKENATIKVAISKDVLDAFIGN
tara:strand:+ start:36767 stop:37741 length:975 start_codon:yes stop_codon:yes gene_type:complete